MAYSCVCFVFFLFPLKDCFTHDSACCLWASKTMASLLIRFNETWNVNLKAYIRAMHYDKETIHRCIRNIFIITVQMPQSWSSLESHFQSERECLRGQVHGVSLAMAGCPSFHIAAFNHAVPSCRNLKLHGHKCRRARLSVCSKLCAFWPTMVQKQENPFQPSRTEPGHVWTWIWRSSLVRRGDICGDRERRHCYSEGQPLFNTPEVTDLSAVWWVLGPDRQIVGSFPRIAQYSYFLIMFKLAPRHLSFIKIVKWQVIIKIRLIPSRVHTGSLTIKLYWHSLFICKDTFPLIGSRVLMNNKHTL